jgi:serine/threonine protein kinase
MLKSKPLLTTSPDAVKLSSGLNCSSLFIDSTYLGYAIMLVTNFKSLRDIKIEIDFSTIKYISEGCFGKVSTAHLKSGSKVAIKEFKQQAYKDEYKKDVMLAKIWREAANLIKVKGHPKFVEISGIYVNNINNPCISMAIVMECASGDLRAYKNAIVENKEVKLSYENIRYLALEIFSIVDACKQVKIDYLDFHLGNILVFYENKKLKLGDIDKIQDSIGCGHMIYQSSFELLKLSCTNYGKSRSELRDIRTAFTYNKENFKSQLCKFLGGDDVLCDIISEPLIAYRETLKVKNHKPEDMIRQLQSCELEPFPVLEMI